MAPGVSILAAMIPKSDEPGSVPIGEKPSLFGIRSGTSMACPHVTGAAAFIKSVHGRWSPSMIKSALMTTGSRPTSNLDFLQSGKYYIYAVKEFELFDQN